MRMVVAMILAASFPFSRALGADPERDLRFAWPDRGQAVVELTDERTVGSSTRSGVLSMRLHVEPDGQGGRLVLRFSDARIVSVDGVPIRRVNPQSLTVAVMRVMKRATPTIIVSREGHYVESRDLGRVAREVIAAAGFPGIPPGLEVFQESVEDLLSDVATEDWNAWVGLWLGERLEPGEWIRTEREMEVGGLLVPTHVIRRGLEPGGQPGRARFQAVAEYPSEWVRPYTSGFLLDMARDAKELEEDPIANLKFLERARYSPMTETLTAEIETATMRPIATERVRTFFAVAGRHRVEGRERRAHRFTWEAEPGGR